MYKCGICGKEFDDLDNYLEHVKFCVSNEKKKNNDLVKMNHDLNSVKAAKQYFLDQLASFKENYPEAYKMNFGIKDVESVEKSPMPNTDRGKYLRDQLVKSEKEHTKNPKLMGSTNEKEIEKEIDNFLNSLAIAVMTASME